MLLNAPVAPGRQLFLFLLQFAPAGDRVLYYGDQDTGGVQELFVVPSDGSAAPLKLSGSMVAGGNVQFDGARISPDGLRVVYRADALTDEKIELFSVPIDGSLSPRRENGPLIRFGDVQSFQIAPRSTRVVYLADQDTDRVGELYLSYLVSQDWRRGASAPTTTVTVTR